MEMPCRQQMEAEWAVARKGSRKTGQEPANVCGYGWVWASVPADEVENQLSFGSSAILPWSLSDAWESSLNELAFSVLVSGARAGCVLWYSHVRSVGIHWELTQPFSHIKTQGDSILLCHMA